MRARWILLLLLTVLCVPTIAAAQVSFVAASGTTASYANGTMTANFFPPAGSSQFDYLKEHFPFTVSSPLNGSGAWSMSLADTSTLIPAGSQWRMTMCSATGFGTPTCYNVVLPVTCVNNVSCSGSALNMSSSFSGAPTPGSGGGASGTYENVYSAPGSFTFAHNLNSLFYQVHCWTRAGAGYAPATYSDNPVDANDATVTVPAAGDYICSFNAATAIAPDFAFAVTPSTQLYEPTMTGTQHPTFAIAQTTVGGYSGTATYTTSGLASGMTGAYSPTTITGAGSNTLTLSFPFSQAPATTSFTAQGSDGTKTHTQSPSITVGTNNQGLADCWAGNDGSGTAFADGCGTSNTQTVTTGSLTWQSNAGLPGLTPLFSSTAYTTGANHTATNFDGTLPFSVSSWINIPVLGTAAHTIIGTLNPAASFVGWEVSVQTISGTSSVQFFLANSYSANAIVVYGGALASATTYNIVTTYDGTKSSSGVKIYINGVLASNNVSFNSLTGSAANPQNPTIGARSDGTAPVNGIIAYTRIYSRVLSQTDVTNYYAAGPR
jgi:hypothetical protein